MKKAVERIMFAKQYNAGQVCVNVDYIFIPEDRIDAFVEAARDWVKEHCPDINSRDYTSIIDKRAFDRLTGALADAEQKGARLVNLSKDQQPNPETRKLPLYLVLNTTEDMILRQREIFGPIMPVIPYKDSQEILDYINQHDRPLAFYPLTFSKLRPVFYQAGFSALKFLSPPYGKLADRVTGLMLKMKK